MFVIPAPNPIAFNIYNIPIYKYGIVLALGIFIAILTANTLFNKINQHKDIIIEYAPLIIISGILGARIYFCLLNSGFYLSHPIEILDIRQGGLSIHGAIIGGLLSMGFLSYKSKIPFLNLMDSISVATFLGQAIGRWGNYFNSEAFGYPVQEQNWGLFIPQNLRPIQYTDFNLFHPTFLYESLLDLAGFCIMLFIFNKYGKSKIGVAFFSYLILYALIRFFIEQIRIDSALNIGSIPIAEIVSIILLLCGIIGIITIFMRNVKDL